MKRPHIILIHSDQHRADALSLEGHPDHITPNLDELASQGAWFRNAYTPAPVCCPARRTLLTGHTPATDGCLSNDPVRIPHPHDTLPNLLRLAGYQTADLGRSFHQYPSGVRHGFETVRRSPWEDHDSRAWNEMRPLSTHRRFNNWPHLLVHGMPLDGYSARDWPYDEALHQTTWTINRAIDFLDQRDVDAPLFMAVGTVAPHPPLIPPKFYYDRYDRRQLTPPKVGAERQLIGGIISTPSSLCNHPTPSIASPTGIGNTFGFRKVEMSNSFTSPRTLRNSTTSRVNLRLLPPSGNGADAWSKSCKRGPKVLFQAANSFPVAHTQVSSRMHYPLPRRNKCQIEKTDLHQAF